MLTNFTQSRQYLLAALHLNMGPESRTPKNENVKNKVISFRYTWTQSDVDQCEGLQLKVTDTNAIIHQARTVNLL